MPDARNDTYLAPQVTTPPRRYVSVPHVPAVAVTHTGPGHRYADPSYCEGCFWLEEGRWRREQPTPCKPNCPACKEAEMISGRYRKKPVEIDAHEWDGDWDALMAWLVGLGYEGEDSDGTDGGPPLWVNEDGSLSIDTLEGTMNAPVGWVVIRGVKQEFYACERDIFDLTYDSAHSDAA